MSRSKQPIMVLDDDEDECSSLDSSKSRIQRSLSQKRKSSECHLLKRSKSQPAGTGSKSLSCSQSKRQNSWISSSFDAFEASFSSFGDIPIKKKACSKTSSEGLSSQQSKELWIDKYKPQCEADLAVHKKKIEDVRSWMLHHLCSKSNAILLLTGPVGVGKTATVHALSKELDYEIQEWINPTTVEGFTFGNEFSQSQLTQFQDFLLRSNKYPTLSIFSSTNDSHSPRKIILLEDLPNIFYRDSKKLHEILMEYRQKGRCPLVLIVSDSHYDDSNVYKLLPKPLQHSLGVSNISFNPVANTSLLKTLNKIVSLESKKDSKGFSQPSKDVINELVQSCSGDIRTAINALQFSCQKGIQDNVLSKYKATNTSTKNKKQKKESKKTQESQAKKSVKGVLHNKGDIKEDSQETLKAIGGKDTSIFLFRALGKILYCKRDTSTSDKDLLPSHMSHLARNQPQFSPEEVVDRSHLSSEMLSLYLHQNFVDFYNDIDDVVNASEYFSDANMMSMEWMHRSSLTPYMSCMVTRGLMYNSKNTSTSRGGWRPLHKPQWFDVNKKARSNSISAKEFFPEQTCPNAVLYSEIIPYLAITDVTMQTPGQISFVQQMGQYKTNKSTFRSYMDTLDEKECCEESDDDRESRSSQSCSQPGNSKVKLGTKPTSVDNYQNSQGKDNEVDINMDVDAVIEDFDDDW